MSSPSSQLVSIITPTFNSESRVERCIASVKEQLSQPAEHILVDGGSRDRTVDIGREAGCRVLEGPDHGMYHALNRGILHSRGNWLLFLNSDDCLPPESIARLLAAITARDVQVVTGGCELLKESVEVGLSHVRYIMPTLHPLVGATGLNGSLFAREIFAIVGLFNARYRVAGDREFMLRLRHFNIRSTAIRDLVYSFVQHPDSMTLSGREIDQTEDLLILRQLACDPFYRSSRTELLHAFGMRAYRQSAMAREGGSPGRSLFLRVCAGLARGAASLAHTRRQ